MFLRDIRRHLKTGDALLLGTDVEKSIHDMLLAYDDPTGVTAAFNLESACPDQSGTRGRLYSTDTSNTTSGIKKWTVASKCTCARHGDRPCRFEAADFTCIFREGETIWTEACHKFRVEEIPGIARRTGFLCEAQWIDTEWAFAENLLIAD